MSAPECCPKCGGDHIFFYAGKSRCHCGWSYTEPALKRANQDPDFPAAQVREQPQKGET